MNFGISIALDGMCARNERGQRCLQVIIDAQMESESMTPETDDTIGQDEDDDPTPEEMCDKIKPLGCCAATLKSLMISDMPDFVCNVARPCGYFKYVAKKTLKNVNIPFVKGREAEFKRKVAEDIKQHLQPISSNVTIESLEYDEATNSVSVKYSVDADSTVTGAELDQRASDNNLWPNVLALGETEVLADPEGSISTDVEPGDFPTGASAAPARFAFGGLFTAVVATLAVY